MVRMTRRGFTLVEMLFAMVILAILVGVSFAALRGSRAASERAVADADAKIFNDAVRRVELGSDRTHWNTLSNIIHVQKNGPLAIQWLVSNHYVRR